MSSSAVSPLRTSTSSPWTLPEIQMMEPWDNFDGFWQRSVQKDRPEEKEELELSDCSSPQSPEEDPNRNSAIQQAKKYASERFPQRSRTAAYLIDLSLAISLQTPLWVHWCKPLSLETRCFNPCCT